ncbi:unannotated protein [freshwater metagenome]|uniref:Unannotated protein n=1 Tax=freshwater metagenome TaxID=449393 RepID=A0A6J7CR71_9ZZZZ
MGRGGFRRFRTEFCGLQLKSGCLLFDVRSFLLATLFVRFTLPKIVFPSHVVDVKSLAVCVEIEHAVHGFGHECDIVRDDNHAALVVGEEIPQPDNGVGVEVVCRFIENHRLCIAEQDAG